ncbi:hypothetical protein [Micromonospora sp. NPDC049799]|uniref:hypothetical protein n=1 Tax=Micromonospora sp. NPDC049799 TaxID=3154741 RepID=UPI0033DE9E84
MAAPTAPTRPAVVRGVAAPTGPAVLPGSAAQVEPPVRHGVVPVEPATADEPVDVATQLLQPPDVTAAIFVDRSGRRGHLLRQTVYALVAIALLLVVAFWLVQGLDAFGSTS